MGMGKGARLSTGVDCSHKISMTYGLGTEERSQTWIDDTDP
jgi:hypothetical protein